MTIVDVNLVYCLIPMTLTLMLVDFLFKNRFETKKALNLIRLFIVGYSIVTLILFLFEVILMHPKSAFIDRASYTSLTMILLSTVLPFSLLNKKLGSSFAYILLVSFIIKGGEYFERFVIFTTSLHREYEPNFTNPNWHDSVTFGVLIIWVQGFLLGVFTLWIYTLIKRSETAQTISDQDRSNWSHSQKVFWISKINIEIGESSFEIKQSLFGFEWKKIIIKFTDFKSDAGSHIYLTNKNQRVAIVFTEDLEYDFLNVTEDYHNSINYTSNANAENLVLEIEKRITNAAHK